MTLLGQPPLAENSFGSSHIKGAVMPTTSSTAISKRLRFEVFKRDQFTCVYCGKTPPEVTLETDHLEPRASGGSHSIDNLVTACFDCNRGKAHIRLGCVPGTVVQNAEVLREREAQLLEYRRLVARHDKRTLKDIQDISVRFESSFPGKQLTEKFQTVSLRTFLRTLPKEEVLDALRLAAIKRPYDAISALKYFCGICWTKIRARPCQNGS